MVPIFVVLEGVDRCGKTSQAHLLRRRLNLLGLPASAYGTPDRRTAAGELAGRLLRGELLLVEDGGHYQTSEVKRYEALALQCLFTCCRYEVAARVRRDLGSGTSVACVRWWPSAVSYAGEDGLDPEAVREHSSFLPEPDLLVLLDADPAVVAGRLDPRERYEASLDVQSRLALSYRRLWAEQAGVLPGKWATVDVGLAPDAVAEGVWGAVCRLRPELAEPGSRLVRKIQLSSLYGKIGTPGEGEEG